MLIRRFATGHDPIGHPRRSPYTIRIPTATQIGGSAGLAVSGSLLNQLKAAVASSPRSTIRQPRTAGPAACPAHSVSHRSRQNTGSPAARSRPRHSYCTRGDAARPEARGTRQRRRHDVEAVVSCQATTPLRMVLEPMRAGRPTRCRYRCSRAAAPCNRRRSAPARAS